MAYLLLARHLLRLTVCLTSLPLVQRVTTAGVGPESESLLDLLVNQAALRLLRRQQRPQPRRRVVVGEEGHVVIEVAAGVA